MKPPVLKAALAVAAVLSVAGAAFGQEVDQRRIDRQLRVAETALSRFRPDPSLTLDELSFFDVGGNLSFQSVFLKDQDANSRTLLQSTATLYARGSINGAHTAFARATFAYRAFSEGDSFDGRGDRLAEPIPDRYWYEFDLRNALAAGNAPPIDGNFNIRVGRQFIDWGAGLALSETLYAARPTLELSKNLRIEGLAGITPDHTVDFDASRVDYDEKTRRTYFGARVVAKDAAANEYYAFYLYSGDNYNRTESRAPIVFTDAKFDHASNFLGLGTNLTIGDDLQVLFEAVAQLGTNYSDPLRGTQTREDVKAGATRAQFAYLLRDATRSRIELEFLAGTGDDDRLSSTDTVGGNAPGTTDHAFNTLGFANTGLAFGGSLNNLWSTRLGYSCEPFPDLGPISAIQVGIDGFIFSKISAAAPIDELTNQSKFLGGEVDLFLNYRINSDLSFSARYGIFLPGEAIAGSHHARDFALFSIVLSF